MAILYWQGFTLRNYLFCADKLTANAAPDKYSYSGYGILMDEPGTISLFNNESGKNKKQ